MDFGKTLAWREVSAVKACTQQAKGPEFRTHLGIPVSEDRDKLASKTSYLGKLWVSLKEHDSLNEAEDCLSLGFYLCDKNEAEDCLSLGVSIAMPKSNLGREELTSAYSPISQSTAEGNQGRNSR